MSFLSQVEEHRKKDPAVLAVFKSEKDSAFKAYEKAAGGLWSDYDFAHTFDASLVEEVSITWLQPSQHHLQYEAIHSGPHVWAFHVTRQAPTLCFPDFNGMHVRRPKVFRLCSSSRRMTTQ